MVKYRINTLLLLTLHKLRIIITEKGTLMKGKEMLRLLEKNGWSVVRIKGSHHILKKGEKIITVPVHNTDLPVGLANAILKQAGLK